MTSHSESRIVSYPADLMFAIVADVERYPEFVPWVTALRIKERERKGDKDILIAETVVGFKALRERYTSRVVLDKAAWRIDVTQTEGVFRILENHWHFAPQDNKSCRVDFAISYEFKSKLLGAITGSAFELVVAQMTHAFEARAKKLSQQTL